jgi:hypothetical protein
VNPLVLYLLVCRACDVPFALCRSCYHGQVYCGDECRHRGWLENHRVANKRDQQSPEGRRDHAERQREYLAQLTARVPDLKPGTLVVIIDQRYAWRASFTFRHAVEYVYQGRATGHVWGGLDLNDGRLSVLEDWPEALGGAAPHARYDPRSRILSAGAPVPQRAILSLPR